MKHIVWIAVLAVGVVLAMVVAHRQDVLAAAPKAASSTGKVRIGVYDSRAIAVAWAASEFNPVRQKMAEHTEAKKKNDVKKAEELEAWGNAKQRLLHFQGFGRVPVDDLLTPVKKGVATVAKEKKLAAIVMQCDYTAPNVEVVDVTNALVDLYEPNDRTREIVRTLRDVKPVGLLELADMKASD
ncbi:MAG TPA: hypothetical protein PKK84_02470 [Armatimonadota bacterium]|nr:hypothetical protein [Armatimonadota bacterium]